MDVFDILDSLVILVILACSINPSHKIVGADNLVEVIHHLEGEFGRKEGNSGPIIERVPCFVGQGFKFGNESINFPWCESKMTEFFLCALRGASVLEGCFKVSSDSVPVKLIIGVQPHVVLVKGPYSPPLNPVFDVFSLNEPQTKHCSLHWDVNLIRTNIGQAVEVEFIHKGVGFAVGPIKNSGGIPT